MPYQLFDCFLHLFCIWCMFFQHLQSDSSEPVYILINLLMERKQEIVHLLRLFLYFKYNIYVTYAGCF